MRLDRFLALRLVDLSRSRLKALIEAGRIRVSDATISEPSFRVKSGNRISLALPEPEPAAPEPQAIPLTVVFEDDDLIVVDKPAGMVVHPAPGSPDGTLVNALIAHCGASLSGIGGVRRPGIVHRIDKGTSGLLVAAKNDAAHRALASQFEAHTMTRAYLAVVYGRPSPPSGEIEGNIGRDPRNRKRMAVLQRGGKPALTRYKVKRTFLDAASLVECRLATGRTHQIRVHLSHRGHPVVGDTTYARSRRRRLTDVPTPVRDALAAFPRQALHAALLGLQHPATGRPLEFESPLPEDIRALVDLLSQYTAPA